MQQNLLLGALAIGALGAFYSWLTAGARPTTDDGDSSSLLPRPFLLTALALPVVVFLLTLPDTPPFGAGQGFGRGFVIGSISALLAAWIAGRAPRDFDHSQTDNKSTLAAITAPQFIAIIAVAIPLLWMRATIVDALLGVALGWLAAPLLLLQYSWSAPRMSTPLAGGAIFTIALCAVSALGVYRDFLTPEIARGTWSAVALVLAGGVPFSIVLADHLSRWAPLRWTEVLRAFVAGIVLLLPANLLSLKVLGQPRLSLVVSVGLVVGLLFWWQARIASSSEEDAPLQPLGAFLMLAGVVVAFGLLQGFGIGVMLLAVWPLATFAIVQTETESRVAPREPAHHIALLQLLGFGAILLLQRLFEQRFRADLRGVAITDYYALLGFLSGAILPLFLANLLHRSTNDSTTTSLSRLVLAGIVALAAPTILLMVWGAKVSLALFFGLALSFLLARRERSTPALNATLLALAVALALTEWTRHVLPLAELSRGDRIRALSFVVGLILFAIIAGDLAARWKNRRAPAALSSPS